jgi:MFS family permease
VVNLIATLAVFMNGLAASWALTGITDSTAVVAGLQTATALAAFLLALVAGALADIVQRKTLIMVGLGGSALTAGAFTVMSAVDRETVASILVLTVTLGVFTALAAPAWIAVIPGLVPKAELAGAMSLSTAAVTVAMAAGPALAGFLIALASPTAVFALNVVVFVGAMFALRWWRPEDRHGLAPEHIGSAIRVGLRYLRFDRPLKTTIGKVIPLAFAGTVIPALLPVISRFQLDAGPAGFGLLAAAGGVGAIIGLVVLPPIRRRMSPDGIILAASLVDAFAIVLLARSSSIPLAFVSLIVVGIATLAIISTVMTALQIVLPAWVRGRGVAIYLFALQGAFAVGALLWGMLAEQFSVETTLYVAAALLAVSAFAVMPLKLNAYVDYDSDSVQLMDTLPAVTSVHDSDGPILLTVDWDIPDGKREAFLKAMVPVKKALRRQGALDFHLVEDVSIPGRIVESFSVATWSEYQRLPLRSTVADKPAHDALIEVVGAELPPITVHRELRL